MAGSPSLGGGLAGGRAPGSVAVDRCLLSFPVGLAIARRLEQAEPVVVRVDEPGRQREPDIGHAVDGAQLGEVLDLDAACPQLGDLGGEVVHAPAGLGGLIGGPGGALGHDQPAVAATPEGEELLVG
jgi:hypothetical protein